MNRALATCGQLFVALTALVASDASAEDKSGYHLFRPTPRQQLRELTTDRPDTTESPITVDAGHFQLESDLVVLMFDEEGPTKTSGFELVPTNFKAGLLTWMDLQLVVEPYHRVVAKTAGVKVIDDGYGATTLRLKMNLWGNDGGGTALALMPLVTYVDDGFDYGLIAPLGFDLPLGFSSAVMLEVDLIRQANGDRGVNLMPTATISHDLIGPLGAYVEVAATFATYDSDFDTLALDGGLTLGLGDDVQLDAGTRVGLSGPIADLELFLGLSARL